jgi:hypothetical protein
MEKVKILTVHYKTPDLIYKQYDSIRKFYPNIFYHIIDGSDDNKTYFSDLEQKDKNVFVERFGYNIHHGPGMDHAIINSNEKYILILDSDVSIKESFLDEMLTDFSGIAKGLRIIVNDEGLSSWQKKQTKNHDFIYPYIHPYCMLIDKDEYIKFKPFVKHGAPCINFMVDVYNNNQSDRLIHFDIEKYVNLVIRGTRSKWGINL